MLIDNLCSTWCSFDMFFEDWAFRVIFGVRVYFLAIYSHVDRVFMAGIFYIGLLNEE